MQIRNKTIYLLFYLMFATIPCANIFAEYQQPQVAGTNKKFRTFLYNPDDIYKYVGHYMYNTFFEFAEGEAINTISMGDTTAWQITQMGNKLFIKPIADYPETNMTVMTNKRVYYFELDAKDATGNDDKDLIYSIRFIYPDTEDKTIFSFPVSRKELPDLTDLTKYNFDYEYTGVLNIAPLKVFDNGEFTYMEFPERNAEVPAMFMVDNEGYESLVNFRVVENYVVVERVVEQFTLRSGGDVVCIYNNSYDKLRKLR